VNTNGLRLAVDDELALKIKKTAAQVVLSLDTLDSKTSRVIHGADVTASKLAALEKLETFGVPTILLLVWIPGLNDREIPLLLRRYFSRPFVKGATIQTIAYTGFNGARFEPKTRATLEEVENGLEAAGFKGSDFFGHGSYHPLCYSTAYYLVDEAAMLPMSDLVDKKTLTAATSEGYLMRPTEELTREFREKIDALWADGASRGELALLKKLVSVLTVAPGALGLERDSEDYEKRIDELRREAAERSGLIKTLTIHAHMDKDNFDLARAAMCGDLVPEEDGRFRPACSYNLLYRRLDPRFWAEEA
jgi:hypothetical protein